jgi:hypothetical protein
LIVPVILAAACTAFTSELRGKAVNQASVPVKGLVVISAQSGARDTTGPDGCFALSCAPGTSRRPGRAPAGDTLLVFRNSVLERRVPAESLRVNSVLTLDLVPREAVDIAVAQAGRGLGDVGRDLTRYPYGLSRYVAAGTAWCSEFVSWALEAAGYPLSGGRRTPWMITDNLDLRDWFAENSRFVPRTDPYWQTAQPSPGDFIRYNNDTGGHSGMVRDVAGDTLYTVEGNVNGRVVLRTIPHWRRARDIDGIGLRSGRVS